MSDIRMDLSRKLQTELSRVIEREVGIARHVLDLGEIGILMLEASVMMVRTTAATLANSVDQDGDVEKIYDMAVAAVVDQLGAARGNSLERIHAEIAQRRAAA